MGETENFEEKVQEEEPENQVVEGLLGKYQKDWQEKLPSNIDPEMVDLFLGNDGLWYWHLKPPFIKDKGEKEKYEEEKEQWE